MFPLRDENPTPSPPHVTRFFIIVNIVVFLVIWLPSGIPFFSDFQLISLKDAVQNYGMTPLLLLNGERLYSVFTSMFLHGSIIHLAGNMLFLHIFGDNIEYTFGHRRYFAFYLLSGVVASLAHILTINTVEGWLVPAVGASGAISGVMGAYLLLYPKARILTLVLVYWIYIVRIPAVFFLGVWFIFQLFEGTLTLGMGMPSGVAYWAHIGGFVVGMALTPLLRRKRNTPI